MKHLFTSKMRQQLAASRAIATVTVQNVEDAKPLADALLAGGINAVEITMRTPAALEVMKIIADNSPPKNEMSSAHQDGSRSLNAASSRFSL